jgi:hypothetical protein
VTLPSCPTPCATATMTVSAVRAHMLVRLFYVHVSVFHKK